MVVRSTIAGIAGIMMMVAASGHPASAQGACPAGCDGATNWSGFWVGAGIGVNADIIGHDYKNFNAGGAQIGNGTDDGRGGAGFLGTVGVGYDWHLRDRWVVGAFTDFDYGSSEHSETDYWATGNSGWNIKHDLTWSIGARLGLITSNTSMVYGLIGYSRTNMEVNVHATDTGGTPFSHTDDMSFSGLMLGAGLEQDLGNGFFLKGEYRYINYGAEDFKGGARHANLTVTEFESDQFELDSHSFRLTLAYKFDRGGDAIEEVSYKDIPPAPSYTAPYK